MKTHIEVLEEQLSLCELTLDNKDMIIDLKNKYIEKIFDVLIKQGYLKGKEFIPRVNPYHGSCCCCQTCGQGHDECICSHNELLKAIYE